ncbi:MULTISPECIES: Asp-tRNA(Asn)/Glu-tRNA(Gln) amidotransferase subunit GatC [Tsukamurella]|uniref:Aspartyl/glutamyl-tRNA(Asn/Gln) amidotransferase subunit C n=2 Tax=Tsukamurella TaxID=2060 RepID=A0A5C5S2I3_9ACTN|nr:MULTISPECIES: Asp-tRNA(Asn)/Glu-tRNA(Gln) amidotransferase subunit GatC [Tsukamurella]NMD54737.1 Asp-tRNA(Asn)/Glu-tRNA(Gln) amidotransferase subunit GatC [Tsukamurella columbiensis]TWS28645.1 Asp-tRNA(Asn)/Glu-tRNA(Gln) amidotransferase subunit GatC [Tsukamurella conjunctivitidis]
MSAISRDEVAHLARLSRLAVTDDELDVFATQLDSILEHVKVVTEVGADASTADVAPLTLPVGNVNVNRGDEPVGSLTPEEALSGAPNREGDRFAVPRILGEE